MCVIGIAGDSENHATSAQAAAQQQQQTQHAPPDNSNAIHNQGNSF